MASPQENYGAGEHKGQAEATKDQAAGAAQLTKEKAAGAAESTKDKASGDAQATKEKTGFGQQAKGVAQGATDAVKRTFGKGGDTTTPTTD